MYCQVSVIIDVLKPTAMTLELSFIKLYLPHLVLNLLSEWCNKIALHVRWSLVRHYLLSHWPYLSANDERIPVLLLIYISNYGTFMNFCLSGAPIVELTFKEKTTQPSTTYNINVSQPRGHIYFPVEMF